MKCPKCKAENWRCPVYQSVDVEVNEDLIIEDNGIDFSDPELNREGLFCDECGYEPNKEQYIAIQRHIDIEKLIEQLTKLQIDTIKEMIKRK